MAPNSFTFIDWFEILIFWGLFIAISPILGKYMANVLEGKRTFLSPLLGPLERLTYRVAGIDPNEEMSALRYLSTLLGFALLAGVFTFLVLSAQHLLPLNPQGFPGINGRDALNSAISAVTGTHWQTLPPETNYSYASHLAGSTLQSFVSGGFGLAILAAFSRGFSRNKEETLGNFFADFTRAIVYILLPLSILLAVSLIIQGVIQSFDPYVTATTWEGETQVIPQGPVATEIAISQLSGGGGGFFNVGSAHPLENPSALSNFFECLAMLLIPGAAPYAFGALTKSKGQGLWIFTVMFILWIAGLSLALWSENHIFEHIKVDALLEGKESRIGIANSVSWATVATATSNGSLNSALGSATPISQSVYLFNLLAGNVIFGQPGIGICNFFLFIGLTVILAELLVGRTPEYLGKQLEWREIRWIGVGLYLPNFLILLGTAILAMRAGTGHTPVDFTGLAYGVASVLRLNGSRIGSIDFSQPFYSYASSIGMVLGWLLSVIPPLLIAGHLVRKRIYPEGSLEFALLNRRIALFCVFLILAFNFIIYLPLMLIGPLAQDIAIIQGGS